MDINNMKKRDVLTLVAAEHCIYSGLILEDIAENLSDSEFQNAKNLDSRGFYDFLQNFIQNNY
jgi:hypothetical protein